MLRIASVTMSPRVFSAAHHLREHETLVHCDPNASARTALARPCAAAQAAGAIAQSQASTTREQHLPCPISSRGHVCMDPVTTANNTEVALLLSDAAR